ncbi:unnamed protein product [Meganyctiphanes norvegica]|uniref:ornithine decarboxylase n=1 Tax=Meganyctiphanes norvegica TaxID=48144 RepID=A0AAV2Q293_MEGNR
MKLESHFFTNEARILDEQTPMDVLKEITNQPNQEDPFYILDAGDIVQKIKYWRLMMPRVKPFYAVKCNDDLTVLELLAALGTGFDCASKSEMQRVLSLGVEPSRIIYAHPCKPQSHIKAAAKNNIDLMTFDNEAELYKVKAICPQAKLVLRIRCDAEEAQCPLGIKFGVYPEDAGTLLATAQALDLNVVGVSFHVGSGCKDPPVFLRAIAESRQVFDLASEYGFSTYLLDIGGGFPGDEGSSLDELASIINSALDEHFPQGCGVEIIAEPGRYVVASAFTLATNVVAKREVKGNNNELVSTMYYINDGVYSSFNCILYDHQKVEPIALKNDNNLDEYDCSIWGPTCDGLDQVVMEARLPKMAIGDWIIWKNMGAYTLAAAGSFNGFPKANVHVVVPHHTWMYLEEYMGTKFVLGEANNSEQPWLLPAYQHSLCSTRIQDKNNCSANNFQDKFAKMAMLDFEECGEM